MMQAYWCNGLLMVRLDWVPVTLPSASLAWKPQMHTHAGMHRHTVHTHAHSVFWHQADHGWVWSFDEGSISWKWLLSVTTALWKDKLGHKCTHTHIHPYKCAVYANKHIASFKTFSYTLCRNDFCQIRCSQAPRQTLKFHQECSLWMVFIFCSAGITIHSAYGQPGLSFSFHLSPRPSCSH